MLKRNEDYIADEKRRVRRERVRLIRLGLSTFAFTFLTLYIVLRLMGRA